MKKLTNLLILVLLLQNACGSVPKLTEIPKKTIYGYPVTQNIEIEAYPSPASFNEFEDLSVIQPDPDKATLKGKIMLRSGFMLSKTTIYLTPAVGVNKDLPPIILIGPEENSGDLVSQTNNQGEFVFNNILPGFYYLIASSSNSYSIIEDNNQKPLLIKLRSGELMNLSLVTVSLP